MEITLFHMRYSPDQTGTAPLVTQLAEDLVEQGEEVTVITSLPHYGRTSVHPDYQNIRGLFTDEKINGVRLIRTWVFVPPKPKLLYRVLNYLSYTVLSLIAGLRLKNSDVVLAINPPITTPFSAWMSAVVRQVPLVVGIQDIWPDCVIRVGKLDNPIVVAISRWVEKLQYILSDKIIVLSDAMKDNLLDKKVKLDKIAVIPNWADFEEVKPLPKNNQFTEKYNLQGKFVLLFSGNHGYNAGLENILEAAGLMRDREDILYILAGDGNAKKKIVSIAEENQINNILFLPTQSKDIWLQMLASADIGLVTLRSGLGSLNVPSKVYTLMAAAKPILAAVPADSEVTNIINEANCGWVIPPEDPGALAAQINRIKDRGQELGEVGQRGREYIKNYAPRSMQTNAYRDLMYDVVSGK